MRFNAVRLLRLLVGIQHCWSAHLGHLEAFGSGAISPRGATASATSATLIALLPRPFLNRRSTSAIAVSTTTLKDQIDPCSLRGEWLALSQRPAALRERSSLLAEVTGGGP